MHRYHVYGLSSLEVAQGDLSGFEDKVARVSRQNIDRAFSLANEGHALAEVSISAYAVSGFDEAAEEFRSTNKEILGEFFCYLFLNAELQQAVNDYSAEVPGAYLGCIGESDFPGDTALLLRLSFFKE